MFSRKTITNFLFSALASLLATAIYFLIEYVQGKPLEPASKFLLLILGAGLIASILLILSKKILDKYLQNWLRPAIEEEIKNQFEKNGYKEYQKETEQLTGIIKIFPNFSACESEILEHCKESKNVRVFLQIGKTVLAGTTNFYDYLGNTVQPDARVKILHASIESPYLSERIAHQRESDYEEWVLDLEHAMRKVQTLSQKRTKLDSRQHNEGFIWRLFIFEDVAYIQPYLHESKNSDKAPVYKLSKDLSFSEKGENENSLYKSFSNYFDFKWEEYKPDRTSLAETIPQDNKSTVACVIKFSQFYIFAIPSRYIKPDVKEIPFHGIGGKVNNGENFIDAVNREVKEETGVSLKIQSSARTKYHTSGAELAPLELKDDPRPYCLYKRTREVDPNFSHTDVLWLVGYEGELDIKRLNDLHPKSEVGAFVCLTGDMLIKCLLGKVTYKNIEDSGDSRLILGENVSFDKSLRAVPTGLATIVAVEERPRLLRRL